MASSATGLRPGDQSQEVKGLLPSPYLLFLGDIVEPGYAKTAFGLRDWAPDRCVGELVLADGCVTTGLARLSVREASERGARALLIGVATRGGQIPEQWLPTLIEALGNGLDIVSGMHMRLDEIPQLVAEARRSGRRLIDVRVPPKDIPVASGRKRSGRRLLTVGTDCALGKKYTALAIARGLAARGIDVDFRATGQTGTTQSRFIVDDRDTPRFRVHRSSMRDPEILEIERRAIFDKTWLFVGHETEIEKIGRASGRERVCLAV